MTDHLTFCDAASLRHLDRKKVVPELESAYGIIGASSSSNVRFTLADLAYSRTLQERLQSPGCAAKADSMRREHKRPEQFVDRVHDSLYTLGKGSGLSVLLAAEAPGPACLANIARVFESQAAKQFIGVSGTGVSGATSATRPVRTISLLLKLPEDAQIPHFLGSVRSDGRVVPYNDLPDPEADPEGFKAAVTERLDKILGEHAMKLVRGHVQLVLLALGFDYIDAADEQPGQVLLAQQLQAQLLLNLYSGSSLYPVLKDLVVDWPLTTLDKVLQGQPPQVQQQKRKHLREARQHMNRHKDKVSGWLREQKEKHEMAVRPRQAQQPQAEQQQQQDLAALEHLQQHEQQQQHPEEEEEVGSQLVPIAAGSAGYQSAAAAADGARASTRLPLQNQQIHASRPLAQLQQQQYQTQARLKPQKADSERSGSVNYSQANSGAQGGKPAGGPAGRNRAAARLLEASASLQARDGDSSRDRDQQLKRIGAAAAPGSRLQGAPLGLLRPGSSSGANLVAANSRGPQPQHAARRSALAQSGLPPASAAAAGLRHQQQQLLLLGSPGSGGTAGSPADRMGSSSPTGAAGTGPAAAAGVGVGAEAGAGSLQAAAAGGMEVAPAEPAKEPVRGPAAGCLAEENLEGCVAAQAVLAEVHREFGAMLAQRARKREVAGKSGDAVLPPEKIKKDLDKLVQVACKHVLKQLPADSPKAQQQWSYALSLAAAEAVKYAKQQLERLPDAALKALAHKQEEEEVTSVRGNSSSKAAACDVPAAIRAARLRQGLLMLMDAKNYRLPKPSFDQHDQWPVPVLEPMFWLLYAVQTMMIMGPLRPDQQAPNMQCVDTAVAAKAQCVPAESRVDEFKKRIEEGWHSWRFKLNKLQQQQQQQQQQQEERKQQQQDGQQQEFDQPESKGNAQPQGQLVPVEQQAQQQQQQEQQQEGKTAGKQQPQQQLLLLGCYSDAQQWVVEQVLPGLERHPHLAGLLALLRKWTSRKVEGGSVHMSLEEHDFDSQYVLQDPAVLGEQRRLRREQEKREQQRSKRRAQRESRDLAAQRGTTPVPTGTAAAAGDARVAAKPVAAARAAGAPAAGISSRRTAAAAAGGVAASHQRLAADRQRASGSSRAAAAAAAGGGADIDAFEHVDEHHGESDTPAPRSQGPNGRASTGVTSASVAAEPRATTAGNDDMPPSPGDSSGSRCAGPDLGGRARHARPEVNAQPAPSSAVATATAAAAAAGKPGAKQRPKAQRFGLPLTGRAALLPSAKDKDKARNAKQKDTAPDATDDADSAQVMLRKEAQKDSQQQQQQAPAVTRDKLRRVKPGTGTAEAAVAAAAEQAALHDELASLLGGPSKPAAAVPAAAAVAGVGSTAATAVGAAAPAAAAGEGTGEGDVGHRGRFAMQEGGVRAFNLDGVLGGGGAMAGRQQKRQDGAAEAAAGCEPAGLDSRQHRESAAGLMMATLAAMAPPPPAAAVAGAEAEEIAPAGHVIAETPSGAVAVGESPSSLPFAQGDAAAGWDPMDAAEEELGATPDHEPPAAPEFNPLAVAGSADLQQEGLQPGAHEQQQVQGGMQEEQLNMQQGMTEGAVGQEDQQEQPKQQQEQQQQQQQEDEDLFFSPDDSPQQHKEVDAGAAEKQGAMGAAIAGAGARGRKRRASAAAGRARKRPATKAQQQQQQQQHAGHAGQEAEGGSAAAAEAEGKHAATVPAVAEAAAAAKTAKAEAAPGAGAAVGAVRTRRAASASGTPAAETAAGSERSRRVAAAGGTPAAQGKPEEVKQYYLPQDPPDVAKRKVPKHIASAAPAASAEATAAPAEATAAQPAAPAAGAAPAENPAQPAGETAAAEAASQPAAATVPADAPGEDAAAVETEMPVRHSARVHDKAMAEIAARGKSASPPAAQTAAAGAAAAAEPGSIAAKERRTRRASSPPPAAAAADNTDTAAAAAPGEGADTAGAGNTRQRGKSPFEQGAATPFTDSPEANTTAAAAAGQLPSTALKARTRSAAAAAEAAAAAAAQDADGKAAGSGFFSPPSVGRLTRARSSLMSPAAADATAAMPGTNGQDDAQGAGSMPPPPPAVAAGTAAAAEEHRRSTCSGSGRLATAVAAAAAPAGGEGAVNCTPSRQRSRSRGKGASPSNTSTAAATGEPAHITRSKSGRIATAAATAAAEGCEPSMRRLTSAKSDDGLAAVLGVVPAVAGAVAQAEAGKAAVEPTPTRRSARAAAARQGSTAPAAADGADSHAMASPTAEPTHLTRSKSGQAGTPARAAAAAAAAAADSEVPSRGRSKQRAPAVVADPDAKSPAAASPAAAAGKHITRSKSSQLAASPAAADPQAPSRGRSKQPAAAAGEDGASPPDQPPYNTRRTRSGQLPPAAAAADDATAAAEEPAQNGQRQRSQSRGKQQPTSTAAEKAALAAAGASAGAAAAADTKQEVQEVSVQHGRATRKSSLCAAGSGTAADALDAAAAAVGSGEVAATPLSRGGARRSRSAAAAASGAAGAGAGDNPATSSPQGAPCGTAAVTLAAASPAVTERSRRVAAARDTPAFIGKPEEVKQYYLPQDPPDVAKRKAANRNAAEAEAAAAPLPVAAPAAGAAAPAEGVEQAANMRSAVAEQSAAEAVANVAAAAAAAVAVAAGRSKRRASVSATPAAVGKPEVVGPNYLPQDPPDVAKRKAAKRSAADAALEAGSSLAAAAAAAAAATGSAAGGGDVFAGTPVSGSKGHRNKRARGTAPSAAHSLPAAPAAAGAVVDGAVDPAAAAEAAAQAAELGAAQATPTESGPAGPAAATELGGTAAAGLSAEPAASKAAGDADVEGAAAEAKGQAAAAAPAATPCALRLRKALAALKAYKHSKCRGGGCGKCFGKIAAQYGVSAEELKLKLRTPSTPMERALDAVVELNHAPCRGRGCAVCISMAAAQCGVSGEQLQAELPDPVAPLDAALATLEQNNCRKCRGNGCAECIGKVARAFSEFDVTAQQLSKAHAAKKAGGQMPQGQAEGAQAQSGDGRGAREQRRLSQGAGSSGKQTAAATASAAGPAAAASASGGRECWLRRNRDAMSSPEFMAMLAQEDFDAAVREGELVQQEGPGVSPTVGRKRPASRGRLNLEQESTPASGGKSGGRSGGKPSQQQRSTAKASGTKRRRSVSAAAASGAAAAAAAAGGTGEQQQGDQARSGDQKQQQQQQRQQRLFHREPSPALPEPEDQQMLPAAVGEGAGADAGAGEDAGPKGSAVPAAAGEMPDAMQQQAETNAGLVPEVPHCTPAPPAQQQQQGAASGPVGSDGMPPISPDNAEIATQCEQQEEDYHDVAASSPEEGEILDERRPANLMMYDTGAHLMSDVTPPPAPAAAAGAAGRTYANPALGGYVRAGAGVSPAAAGAAAAGQGMQHPPPPPPPRAGAAAGGDSGSAGRGVTPGGSFRGLGAAAGQAGPPGGLVGQQQQQRQPRVSPQPHPHQLRQSPRLHAQQQQQPNQQPAQWYPQQQQGYGQYAPGPMNQQPTGYQQPQQQLWGPSGVPQGPGALLHPNMGHTQPYVYHAGQGQHHQQHWSQQQLQGLPVPAPPGFAGILDSAWQELNNQGYAAGKQ